MRSATRHFWTTGTDPSPLPTGSRGSRAGVRTASSSTIARLSRTGHSGAGTTWTPREGEPATSYARLTSELANHLLHVLNSHLNCRSDWQNCYWHTCICQIDLWTGVMIGEPATSYIILTFELTFRLSHRLLHRLTLLLLHVPDWPLNSFRLTHLLLHMPDRHLNRRFDWHTCYFMSDWHLNCRFDWHTCYWHTCICQIDLWTGVMIGEPATSYIILTFELSFRLSHRLLHRLTLLLLHVPDWPLNSIRLTHLLLLMPDWHLKCRFNWHTFYFICQIDL